MAGDGFGVAAGDEAPDVVDADLDGEDGWLLVDDVLLPAGVEVADGVAANAAVLDL